MRREGRGGGRRNRLGRLQALRHRFADYRAQCLFIHMLILAMLSAEG
jgi:hypothetical protein